MSKLSFLTNYPKLTKCMHLQTDNMTWRSRFGTLSALGVKGYLWRSLKSPVPIVIGIPMMMHSLTPATKTQCKVGQGQHQGQHHNTIDLGCHYSFETSHFIHYILIVLYVKLTTNLVLLAGIGLKLFNKKLPNNCGN